MRSPLAVAITVAIGIAVVGVLVGCVATPATPTRSRPNAVERAAVQRTSEAFGASAADPHLAWVQLWTSNQFPTRLKDCVADQSYGQLAVEVQLPLLRRFSYAIVGSGAQPNEAQAALIIERCAAATPLDDRALRVPQSDWQSLYSYDLTTLKPCLVAHGFAVGSVPSRHDFESLLGAGRPWSPYDAVVVTTRSAWYRVSDACPAFPPTIRIPIASAPVSPR